MLLMLAGIVCGMCAHVESLMQPSSVVIYSLVIRSFSLFCPFHKGKNEGNISKNDIIKNDATSSPEGTQRNVWVNLRYYRNVEERWRKLA